MELVRIYACLCEPIRLRILRLLAEGPLCVCHLQKVLSERQVKVSKHLGYLKSHGLVEVRREGAWRVYDLKRPASPALSANLACLAACVRDETVFQQDAAKLRRLKLEADGSPVCGEPAISSASHA
jgi:ArsR family transcriptional regulator